MHLNFTPPYLPLTTHIQPQIQLYLPIYRLIRMMPSPAMSTARDRGSFEGGGPRPRRDAAEPRHSLLLLPHHSRPSTFPLLSGCPTLDLLPTSPCWPLRLPLSCSSCASSCRLLSRDPALWFCPPLSPPPLAFSTGALVVRHILVDSYTGKTRELSLLWFCVVGTRWF